MKTVIAKLDVGVAKNERLKKSRKKYAYEFLMGCYVCYNMAYRKRLSI